MKKLKWHEFVKCPKGTLFFDVIEYGRYTTDLLILDDIIIGSNGDPIDFFYKSFLIDWDHDVSDCPCCIGQEYIGRDGVFDYTRDFYIFENSDIKVLISRLGDLIK